RIEPVVRVAERVDVAHRSRDLAGGDLEDLRRERRVEVAFGARLDLGVAALVDERRQPADLQLATHHDQQVGGVELEDEARVGFATALWRAWQPARSEPTSAWWRPPRGAGAATSLVLARMVRAACSGPAALAASRAVPARVTNERNPMSASLAITRRDGRRGR